MHPTDTQSSAALSGSFLRTLSRGLLLFSAVLTAVLFLSWSVLLPRFTQFAVGDGAMTPREMAQREGALRAELVTMEAERIRLVLPFQDALFSMLKNDKQSIPSLEAVRREVRQAAARAQAADMVLLQEISLDATERRVVVTGDVQGAGVSSMTVLAAFLGEVERLAFVDTLEHPSFSRVDDPVIGIHSPFRFSFTLAPSTR